MSLLDRVKQSPEHELESKENLIKNSFLEKAATYWGQVSKLKIYEHRTTSNNTTYYLIICECKNGEKVGKLLQEWYVGKDGIPRPNGKRQIWLSIDIVDEIAGVLYE